MKSKPSRYLIVPLIFCTLVACSTTPSVDVKTDYDHSAAFGKYHTYAIDTAPTGLSATGNAALQSALRSSLASRGFHEESAGKADLYIVPTVFTQEKLRAMPVGGYTYYPSMYGRYIGGSAMNVEVRQYTEGSLVLDFVDRKTHKLVFRGLGQAGVSTTERNAAAIQAAVNKIVAAYPG